MHSCCCSDNRLWRACQLNFARMYSFGEFELHFHVHVHLLLLASSMTVSCSHIKAAAVQISLQTMQCAWSAA